MFESFRLTILSLLFRFYITFFSWFFSFKKKIKHMRYYYCGCNPSISCSNIQTVMMTTVWHYKKIFAWLYIYYDYLHFASTVPSSFKYVIAALYQCSFAYCIRWAHQTKQIHTRHLKLLLFTHEISLTDFCDCIPACMCALYVWISSILLTSFYFILPFMHSDNHSFHFSVDNDEQ